VPGRVPEGPDEGYGTDLIPGHGHFSAIENILEYRGIVDQMITDVSSNNNQLFKHEFIHKSLVLKKRGASLLFKGKTKARKSKERNIQSGFP